MSSPCIIFSKIMCVKPCRFLSCYGGMSEWSAAGKGAGEPRHNMSFRCGSPISYNDHWNQAPCMNVLHLHICICGVASQWQSCETNLLSQKRSSLHGSVWLMLRRYFIQILIQWFWCKRLSEWWRGARTMARGLLSYFLMLCVFVCVFVWKETCSPKK